MTDHYTWRPWHSWTPLKTTQIDGRLELPGGVSLPLDVWAEDDEDITVDMIRGAHAVWRNGGVRFEIVGGLVNLIIPSPTLTKELVSEAILRFTFSAYGVTNVVIEDDKD